MAVQLLARLHGGETVVHAARCLQVRQQRGDGTHGRAQGAHRVYDAVVAQLAVAIKWKHGALAKFCHVRQQIRAHPPVDAIVPPELVRHPFKVSFCLQPFWEDHVSTSVNVGFCPVHGGVHSFHASGIRASAEHNGAVLFIQLLSGTRGSIDLLGEVFPGHQSLAVQVPTPLRHDLIFNVEPRCPRPGVLYHCFDAHLSLSKAGISISKHR
mmetsp:Transcript_2211/g.2570  ORF Transcript_2211/g.2570 Transcript_2211/m.2570 type:complete len:211 (-) Transcript_2211:245-877(-)